LPDSIVQHFLKGNDTKFFDTNQFDKEHAESFDNVVEGLKNSIEKALEMDSNDDDNNKPQINDLVMKHITQVKNHGGANNEKILNYFYKLADEKKGLKETIKDFQSEYTLKGVFFSYTTPVDCNIFSPKAENL